MISASMYWQKSLHSLSDTILKNHSKNWEARYFSITPKESVIDTQILLKMLVLISLQQVEYNLKICLIHPASWAWGLSSFTPLNTLRAGFMSSTWDKSSDTEPISSWSSRSPRWFVTECNASAQPAQLLRRAGYSLLWLLLGGGWSSLPRNSISTGCDAQERTWFRIWSEAFTVTALLLLSESWKSNPPFLSTSVQINWIGLLS